MAGVLYRQITHKLRIHRGPGRGERLSERPRDDRTRRFLDSPERPTLVQFDEGDRVDVAWLLAIGAIAPWEPPASPDGGEEDRGDGQAE